MGRTPSHKNTFNQCFFSYLLVNIFVFLVQKRQRNRMFLNKNLICFCGWGADIFIEKQRKISFLWGGHRPIKTHLINVLYMIWKKTTRCLWKKYFLGGQGNHLMKSKRLQASIVFIKTHRKINFLWGGHPLMKSKILWNPLLSANPTDSMALLRFGAYVFV